MKLSAIVAMAENRAIGIENRLPWHLSSDLKYFKQTTMSRPILMGRKTFDSIGRPLPGRPNIVLTSQKDWRHDGVYVVHSPEAALALCAQLLPEGETEAMLIGGAQLYDAMLPMVAKLYITEVKCSPAADAFFPEISGEVWREKARTHCNKTEKDDFDFDLVVLERI